MIVESLLVLAGTKVACDIVHDATNPSKKKRKEQRELERIKRQQKQLNDEIKRKNEAQKAFSEVLKSVHKKS